MSEPGPTPEEIEAEEAEKRERRNGIIRDIVGLAGFAVFVFGIWLVEGTGWACIIGGAALFGLTIIGQLRRPPP
jgi:hypothetical protein